MSLADVTVSWRRGYGGNRVAILLDPAAARARFPGGFGRLI
jgi:hypothetical protein